MLSCGAATLTATWTYAQQAPSAPAAARDGAALALDEVTLRDGTVLRGQVTERRSDGSVIFVLLDGARRELAADAIATARGPGFAPANAPANASAGASGGGSAPVAVDEPEPYAPGPGRAALRLRSLGGPLVVSAIVQRAETRSDRYEFEQLRTRPLCTTPCTLYVPPSAVTLHVSAPGVTAYQPELVAPGAYDLRAPRAVQGSVGAGLVIGGALALLLGVALTTSDLAAGNGPGAPGLVVGSVGLAATVTGAVLLATNRSGAVRVGDAASAPPGPSASAQALRVAPAGLGLRVAF